MKMDIVYSIFFLLYRKTGKKNEGTLLLFQEMSVEHWNQPDRET